MGVVSLLFCTETWLSIAELKDAVVLLKPVAGRGSDPSTTWACIAPNSRFLQLTFGVAVCLTSRVT